MSDDDEIPELAALTDERERAFVLAMLECENQTIAAEHAGYTGSRQVLANKGSQLMKRGRIRAALQAVCRNSLGTRGIVNAVKALENAASNPSAKDHIKAASKLVDFTFPPTQRLEVQHSTKADDRKIERVKSFSLDHGVPLSQLLGPNHALGREYETHQASFDQRWGHETAGERFGRLCRLVAQMGAEFAPAIIGQRLTAEQQAHLNTVLSDPRHMLAAIELKAEPAQYEVTDAELREIIGPDHAENDFG